MIILSPLCFTYLFYIAFEGKTKESTSKAAKRTLEELSLSVLAWIFHFKPFKELNVSQLMYHALRHQPNIRDLNRVDTNAVMLKVFKDVRYPQKGIFALR